MERRYRTVMNMDFKKSDKACAAAVKPSDRFCGACGARLIHTEGDAGQKDV